MAGDPLQGVAFQSVDDHDEKALTEEQQAQLNKTKVDVIVWSAMRVCFKV